jgi:DNA modification methylase
MEIRDRIKELRRVKASELVPNEKNWRRHPSAQKSALAALLVEIGYAGALIARERPDGKLVLLDGHLRRDTTPTMEVPVLVVDLTEEEGDKLLATHDLLAGMAQADQAKVEALLENIHTDSREVAALLERIAGEAAWQVLNEPQAVVDVPAQIDRAAELRAKWRTAPGQAWGIGPHRLAIGDCREKAVVGRLWPDGGPKIRMVWTDPPYGVSYADKNRFLNKSDRGNRIQKPIMNDHLSEAETCALFRDGLLAISEHCEPGASIYATVPSGPLLSGFTKAMIDGGFGYHQQLIWIKHLFVLGMSDYHHRHEPILYGWREGAPHFFVNDRTQDSVFEVDRPMASPDHPTSKPVALVARMIANSSRTGELVYDCFAGSCTTGVAAHQLGRVAYLVEADPGYAAVGLERFADLGLEPKLVGARTTRS